MTGGGDPEELVFLPCLRAARGPSDGVVLTKKYVEGTEMIARHWPGPVSVLMKEETRLSTEMDLHEYHPEDTLLNLEWRPDTISELMDRIGNAAAIIGFLASSEEEVAVECHRSGIPFVCTSEYAPRTERQIADAELSNLLRRWRRKHWLRQAERARRRMIPLLAGLQCSGTPTYDLYAPLQPNALLFFDNRVLSEQIADDATLARKAADLSSGRPLRLAFGGRLVAMKGVRDLPAVAATLMAQGIDFTFDIYGAGPEETLLRQRIETLGVGGRMRMRGVLDFRTGWVPALQDKVDIFVCPHVQGDPSSTYPEAMSCGVPIAGYANEAFAGIVRTSGAGWTAPLNEPVALAQVIARLADDRDEIVRMARVSRDFACEHCFEQTFARRAAHLISSSRLPSQ